MAMTPIQPNIDNTKFHKPYNQASGVVETSDNLKPLPPQGHLVHDSISNMPKYFVQDIAYDMKAIKDGFAGNANDHQLGRLNDVGLKLGGIGIATVLAARTKNPLLRIMEYAGLGAFLTSMTLYPKIAVNIPSRVVQGYDIGKKYIDDQGRKKSVYQDSNYIPFDMYRGEYPGEDLDLIGDKMGIPRDIKNRHDLIKEQARKCATQNNTLWMLTAGVVPVMSGLIGYGLERGIAPVLQSVRNSRYNSKINHLLNKTTQMSEQISNLSENTLSKDVEALLASYKDKELPKEEFENLIELMTNNMDSNLSEGVKTDLAQILKAEKNGENVFSITSSTANDIVKTVNDNLPSRNKASLERVFKLSNEDVTQILAKFDSAQVAEDELLNIKGEFKKLFAQRMSNEPEEIRAFLKSQQNVVLESISKEIRKNPSVRLDEQNMQKVVNFAKVIGEFKSNKSALDKCKSFKVEHAQETLIARYYGKFERTLLDVLGIKYKDLKQVRLSSDEASKIFDKKLTELVKDDAKYENAIKKLTKVMSDMEIALNGKSEGTSHLKDLITGIENNYNKTAKRLHELGGFKHTIDKLVKEDVATLSNSLNSRQELFDLLDGVAKDKFAGFNYWGADDAKRMEYTVHNAKGVGSSKNLDISRIIERYQGANNSFNRILHMFDVYKRDIPEGNYNKTILEKGKSALMKASSSDHTLKLGTVNNPTFYNDVMRTIWNDGLQKSTQNGMACSKDLASGDVAGRFKKYINRFRDIIGNNDIDFTKPYHKPEPSSLNNYTKSETTRMSKFNLVAQNPEELIKNAAERRYSNQKWLRKASVLGGSVLGIALLSQFCFGKISNPHNIKKLEAENANK